MKKIVFFTENIIGAGGVVRVISLWSNYFSEKYNVEIISKIPGKTYFKLNDKIKVTFKNFKFDKKIFSILNNIKIMYKLIKKDEAKETFYIINKALYIIPIYFLKKFKKINKINFIYFAHGGNSDFENFYMKKKMGKLLVKMIFITFDKVICLYKDTEKMPDIIDEKKIFYIPNPVSFPILEKEKVNKEKIILYVGRITKAKGVDTLLKAWSLLYSNCEYKLFIVGDGEDKEEFKTLVKILGIPENKINFFEGTNDVLPYYEISEVFVLPSKFDGLPMVLIEAKTQRVATIATETSGGKKLIKDCETGLLCKISDEKDLAQKIKKLIEDKELKNKIIENSIVQIKEYEIDKIANKWEKILKI